MSPLKGLFALRTPGGVTAPLSILIFHRVLPEPDALFPDEIDGQRFDGICRWLAKWFRVLPLDVAVAHIKSGTLPSRAACITFDDGYADNHDVALPILQAHGLSSTFFIATNYLDGGRMWNDSVIEAIRLCKLPHIDLGDLGHYPLGSIAQRQLALNSLISRIKYLPQTERLVKCAEIVQQTQTTPSDRLMMTSNQVKTMRTAGMQIGAHTHSHPILTRLTQAQAQLEISGGKRFLENLLGERVGLFAYPNGKPGEDYAAKDVEIVKSLGFDAAVTTQWGVTRAGDDMFQMRRFTPWDHSRTRFGLRLLLNLRHQGAVI